MSLPRSALTTALLAALAPPAGAALFIVDTTAVELGDILPGDGKCEWATIVPAGQRCTLRAAVQEANALAGADVILIPDSWHIVLGRGPSEDNALFGDLDVLDDLTIGSFASPASWPIIEGNQGVRVFEVFAPASLTVGGIEIRGGDGFEAGGLWVHSGARSELVDCRLIDNHSGFGDALFNEGTTSVSHCAIERNVGSDYEGRDISFSGTVTNGIGGFLEIDHSTIAENRYSGSAIYNLGTLIVTNSTIADHSGSPLVAGNGIFSWKVSGGSGDIVLENVTITGHTGSGLKVDQPGAFLSPWIRNSIIAGNGVDCSISIPGGTANTGYPNLDSDGSCGFLPAAGGLPNADPMLGPLQLNGGTTRTRVPRVGSPVIDTGFSNGCRADDQRGAPRPLDGDGVGGAACDLGAAEVLPCVGIDHVYLDNETYGPPSPITVEACFFISAGPGVDVLSGGALVLRARDAIILGDGFSAHSGAAFEANLDPAAGSGMALP